MSKEENKNITVSFSNEDLANVSGSWLDMPKFKNLINENSERWLFLFF